MVVIGQVKSRKNKEVMQEFEGLVEKYAPEEILRVVGLNLIDECGCTANVVLVENGRLYCANLGDSRAACIKNKKFVALSYDHKPDDREEKRRIQDADVGESSIDWRRAS